MQENAETQPEQIGEKVWMLKQPDVEYNANGGSLNPRSQACSTCRWFNTAGYSGGASCHIVIDFPDPIVSNGWCNRWESKGEIKPEPLEVTLTQPVMGLGEMALTETAPEEKGFVERVKQVVIDTIAALRPAQPEESITGFKVIGDHWIATYSNIFEDREKELFSTASCDAYLARLKYRMIDMPVLALWHYVDPNNPERGAKVGKAEMVTRIGGFMVAAGTFDDTELGRAAKAFYSNPKHAAKTKMSHGFWFNPSKFKDGVYHEHNTFEITLLPDGREANSFTGFSVKDMDMPSNITPEARAYMEQVFGKDTTERLIKQREEATEGLKDLGVRYKDFTTPPVVDEKAKKPDAKEDGEETEDEKGEMKKDLAYKALVSDLTEGMGEVVTMIKALAKRDDGLDTAVKSLAERLVAIEAILAEPAQPASAAAKTVTEDADAAKAIGEKSERDFLGQYDPMYPGLNVPIKK